MSHSRAPMKYTVTDQAECVCGKRVDVVAKLGKEYISYHLHPEKKGFCPMSMIETVKS